jgi:hypothetical protein
VVADMDIAKFSWIPKIALEIVDLPAPDGDENTNINPRLKISL